MPVTKCTLDGSTLCTLDDLYDQISAQLSLPGHFGRNLDALWDVLANDVEGPLEIVWLHTVDSKKALGSDYDNVLDLLTDLAGEREDCTLKVFDEERGTL